MREPHFPELRQLAAIDPEFREWLGEAACPEVQRCDLWPRCVHESPGEAYEAAKEQDDHEAAKDEMRERWDEGGL
ncbi:hypothetical protein Aph01nite_76910 [Acrocarpospora phusangensis]|uniref:Uncharacterized protein n=1 Tax=Acrocarpospora phusangensis TaxID=1070424 RepID=A0A919QIC8_9ACTN|nr:hypothetical protein [Acrocarpospora phusangensis]GIH29381.1 hypothetical protein Aph01nite_76910 [Acrocarpospora phusangensis]